MKYVLTMALLMFADAMSTVALLQLGLATEANPLMSALIGFNSMLFILTKTVIGMLAGVGLAYNAKQTQNTSYLKLHGARFTIVISMLLITWHIVCWIVKT